MRTQHTLNAKHPMLGGKATSAGTCKRGPEDEDEDEETEESAEDGTDAE